MTAAMTLARRIADAYETKQMVRQGFYSRVRWENLPKDCRQEHIGIAEAALAGTTYNGHTLPGWVIELANAIADTLEQP